ncbi:cellulase family glycosylhydrolase [Chitinophaga sp.]|uniref:cellulase family glycosylhydrolase n=1 Tax=Chitinophaga sp. TaxID=1869181 RepID=UPI0031DCC574
MMIHYTNRLYGLLRRVQHSLLMIGCLLACLKLTPASAQLSRLHADGKRIVNASGQEVILKGVGLGAWLLQEGYMMKEGGDGPQWSVKKYLYDQGQTDAQVEAFYQSWRNNFITKADIDYIASLGFNCVRLPMHYELFLTTAQRAERLKVIRANASASAVSTYISALTNWYNSNTLFTDTNTEGFRLADSLLKWTAANRMYVILDLHAAPGSQGLDHNINDGFVGNDLYNQAIYGNMTVRLWQALSRKYSSNDGVAFYDLINEPHKVPSNSTIHDMFERLINAVRAEGDTHLLMVEGNGYGNNYGSMQPYTFTNPANLVYNSHRYWNSTDVTAGNSDPNQISDLANIVAWRNTYNVPVWVGETGENNNDWLAANIAAMNSIGVGWCHWTYKRFTAGESAALLRITGPSVLDGAGNMSAVLNNIKFANNIKNTNTIAAVAPGQAANGPVGKTIWLKGFNGKYVSSRGGSGAMWCDSNSVGTYNKFYVVDAGNGKIALRNSALFVSSENGTQAITCSRNVYQGWEKFDWIVNADGTIFLKGSNGAYVSSENGTQAMTCNRTSGSGWEAFSWGEVSSAAPIGQTIWLQGNNGQYVSSKGNVNPMYCNATAVQNWNQFVVGDGGNGKITLSNGGFFVSSENGTASMNCNRTTAQDWEKFDWILNDNGTVSLRSSNALFVSSENGAAEMTCSRTYPQGWEQFRFGIVPAAAARKIAAEETVTADAHTTAELQVYPNPVAKGSPLHISLKSYDGKAPVQVTLVDVNRKVIYSRKESAGKTTIPTGNIAAGFYLVMITSGNKTYTQKVLIQ